MEFIPHEQKLIRQVLGIHRIHDLNDTFIEKMLSINKSPPTMSLIEKVLSQVLLLAHQNIDKKQYPELHKKISTMTLFKEAYAKLPLPPIDKNLDIFHQSSENLHLPVKWLIHTLASSKEVLFAKWDEINIKRSTWTSYRGVEYPISEYMHKILTRVLLSSKKNDGYIFDTCICMELIIQDNRSIENVAQQIAPSFSLKILKKHQQKLMKENISWQKYLTKIYR